MRNRAKGLLSLISTGGSVIGLLVLAACTESDPSTDDGGDQNGDVNVNIVGDDGADDTGTPVDVEPSCMLSANPTQLDMGVSGINETVSAAVTVTYNGDPECPAADLAVSLSGDSVFVTDTTSVNLTVGSSESRFVEFTPTSEGSFEAILTWDGAVTIDVPIFGEGSLESCNGLDDDNDGDVDEGLDTDLDGQADCIDACPMDADNDVDGDGVCGNVDICDGYDDNADNDVDGTPDCLDIEECDGLDNNGDGVVDEGFDVDGDGVYWCSTPGDCDDEDATVYPGATETWYDGIDSDCSGGSDYDQDGDSYEAMLDQDGDGLADGEDCNDLDAATFPGATDTADDGIDQDCDDEDATTGGDTGTDGGTDTGTTWVAVDVTIVSGECADGHGAVYSASFTWGENTAAGDAWYIACNGEATAVATAGTLTEEAGCVSAENSADMTVCWWLSP